MSKTIVKYMLRLPKKIHRQLHELADSQQRSMNRQIIYLIQREHNLVIGSMYEEPPTEAETLEAGYIKGHVSEQEYNEGLGSLNQEPKEQNEPPF